MDRNFNRAVTATLKYEGGWSNHPSDPGGATNLGVTIATFRRYVKQNGTIADLKALTVDQAKTVYRRQYWDAVSGAELPDGVDFAVFDFGVNSGSGNQAAAKVGWRFAGWAHRTGNTESGSRHSTRQDDPRLSGRTAGLSTAPSNVENVRQGLGTASAGSAFLGAANGVCTY